MTTLSFAALQKRIEDAARNAFQEVARNHPAERLCAYALYSDSSAMTVCPSVNSLSHLVKVQATDPSDPYYYKWSPAEWAFEFEGAAENFNDISAALRIESSRLADNAFASFRDGLFECCVSALERLVSEGYFHRDSDTVIRFAVSDFSDPPTELGWIQRLNSRALAEEFERWLQGA
jgi:hypothetical protein